MSMDELKRRGNVARVCTVAGLVITVALFLTGHWILGLIMTASTIYGGAKVVKNMAETGRRF